MLSTDSLTGAQVCVCTQHFLEVCPMAYNIIDSIIVITCLWVYPTLILKKKFASHRMVNRSQLCWSRPVTCDNNQAIKILTVIYINCCTLYSAAPFPGLCNAAYCILKISSQSVIIIFLPVYIQVSKYCYIMFILWDVMTWGQRHQTMR